MLLQKEDTWVVRHGEIGFGPTPRVGMFPGLRRTAHVLGRRQVVTAEDRGLFALLANEYIARCRSAG